MKKLLNSSLAVLALALALLVSGKTAWAATTADGSAVSSVTVQDANSSAALKKYTTTLDSEELIPLAVNADGMLDIAVLGQSMDPGVNLYLLRESGTSVSGRAIYLNEGTIKEAFFSVTKGKYYLYFGSKSSYVSAAQYMTYTVKLFPSSVELKSGKTKKTAAVNISDQYYKFKATKTGLISVKLTDTDKLGGTYTVNLCNSKKKVYTSASVNLVSGNTAYFAVKKGTYYISVKPPTAQDYSACFARFNLKLTFKTYKDVSGSKQSKAKTLSKNKTATGLVLATDKKSKKDWFKFVLKKSAKVTFEANANMTAGYLTVTISSKNKSMGTVDGTLSGSQKKIKTPLRTTTSTKLPKGTYYIAVNPQIQGSSGKYTVKVKY